MRFFKNSQVDLFAVPITLNHEGRAKARSFHGALLTVLFAGFMIWFIYSVSKQMFRHENPNTIVFDSFQTIPDSMELNSETFPLAIGMQLPTSMNLAYFMDPEVYLAVIKLLIYYDEKLPDGTVTKSVKRITLDTEPCTLAHFGSAQESVKDLPLSTLHCINPKQSSLEKVELAGKEDFSTYKILKIEIQQCKNTTNTSTCKPIEEITKKLTLSWINIIYMQSAINPQNFTDPNQRFAATYTTMLSPAMLKSGIIKLNHLNVVDDDGWLFESKRPRSSSKPTMLLKISTFNLIQDTFIVESLN